MKSFHAALFQGDEHTRLLHTLTASSSSSSFASFDPSSDLDTTRSSSPPTSSSTSLCAAAAGDPPLEWSQQNQNQDTSSGASNVDVDHSGFCTEDWCSDSAMEAAARSKCGAGGMAVEEWFTSLPEAASSPGSEQSILRLIMGEVEEASLGVNKLFQIGSAPTDLDFNGGFGVWDHSFSQQEDLLPGATPPQIVAGNQNSILQPYFLPPSLPQAPLSFHHFQASMEGADEKPQVFNPRPFLNQGDNQSPYFLWPLQSEELLSSSSPAPPQRRVVKRQQMLGSEQQRGTITKVKRTAAAEEEGGGHNQEVQQAVMEHLYQAAEMVEMGNPELAQGILARLNHQLSPLGRPFQRAAFYFKEALLQTNNNHARFNKPSLPTNHHSSPASLLYKIGAYKSFSEMSPILHFAHFTCMQALLEALQGSHQIHILDFDIGYGGQWASLMQELALRNNGGNVPSLKITAFVSGASHCELELGITGDNLRHFAAEVGLPFVFQAVGVECLSSLWAAPVVVGEEEAVAVNLQVGYAPVAVVLRLVKQVGARIVVCLDRGQERWDMSFAQHLIYSLQLQWAVLESLEAMSVNVEAVQKIERFLVNPEIERMVSGRRLGLQEKGVAPWRSVFLSSGFSPMPISNFNESQAACVVKRSPVHGFHVEKRHSSLVLCWQTKELLSASAWTCH